MIEVKVNHIKIHACNLNIRTYELLTDLPTHLKAHFTLSLLHRYLQLAMQFTKYSHIASAFIRKSDIFGVV